MSGSRMVSRVAAVVAALLVLPGLAAAASWSPDGKRIAYSFIGGPENIYLVNADGTGQVALVVREERDFRPEWSPDGSHIVFTGVVDGVHVMMRVDPDGKNLEQISRTEEAAGDPDYSPDGKRLVYFTDEPQPRDLWVRDVATGKSTKLTDTPDFQEFSPRWAPDGRRVAFVGKTMKEDDPGDIWILDTVTGERTNLTSTPTDSEFHPDWSHDGTRVVYIRVQEGSFDVMYRHVPSHKEVIVATGNGYAVLAPHYSPDDRFVSFTRTDFAEKGKGMPAIARVSLADGTERTVVKGQYLSQMGKAGE